MKKLILSLVFAAFAASGQTTTSTDVVTSSFVGAIEVLGTRTVQVNLTISYPLTAAPEDYVDVTLLRQDTTAVVQGVSNKSAPLEVFAAAVANAVLDKYPQMQSIGVQILFSTTTAAQQNVQAFRSRPAPSKADPAPAKK